MRIGYNLGFAVRETGQALDRLGCVIQGTAPFLEEVSRHRTLQNLFSKRPSLGQGSFVAPSASLIGDVKVGNNASVWYGSIVRGDDGPVIIGNSTNLQDGVVIRTVPTSLGGHSLGTQIGHKVTIGHGAQLHGCIIEDEVLIGMGATVFEGTHVEKGAMIAAGAVVARNTTIPSGELWAGSPAKKLRDLKPEESSFLPESAQHYLELARDHSKEASKTVRQLLSQ